MEKGRFTWKTNLDDVKCPGIDGKARAAFETLGIESVGDLLEYYPRRYEDRTLFDRFPDQPMAEPVCIRATIVDTSLRRLPGRRSFFEARVEPTEAGGFGGSLVCRWFNMPFIHRILAVDQDLALFGKPKLSGKRLVIDHPEFEILGNDPDQEQIHVERITPIYPLISGVSQKPLRRLVWMVLGSLDADSVPEMLPERSAETSGLSRREAIRQIHFPESFDLLRNARRFLALEEFLALQLRVLKRRRELEERGGAQHCGPGYLLGRLLENLPFSPTGAQTRAIEEVRQDLASGMAMNRLLQGDVGSGKTLVAIAAMLLAVEAGYQAALMAPTQILAEQHYLVIQRWLEPVGVRVGLRTSARKEDGFLPLLAGGDEAQILIGTHALIHGESEFDRLGLVVIDEQHKFGVTQRARLIEQGHHGAPDVLVMTATPIPRTLILSVYGDLDVSILDELPKGRGKVVTGVRDFSKSKEAAAFIREYLEKGRQAYIVYPLIEESEKVKSLAATVEFEKWRELFAPHACDLLHGKMESGEKEAVMVRFRKGETQVLISTTVIEVGVDVPNASIMMIYNAERFGLAQLHQLRGRIGRGEHKSYCILMCDPKGDPEAIAKLKILEETTDGFRIADEDLRLRGPGEVLGTAQSGLDGLKLGDLVTDSVLVREARELAAGLLKKDPGLVSPAAQELLRRTTEQTSAPATLS